MRVVVHCPRCGSTEAGEGESDHLPPGYWQMVCGHCGHAAMCDDWEIKFEWNSSVDAAGELPAFVAPVTRFIEALEAVRGSTQHEVETGALVRELVLRWRGALPELSAALRRLDAQPTRAPLDELACWLTPLPEDEMRARLGVAGLAPAAVEAVTRARQGRLRA